MSLLTESKHLHIWICWCTILHPNQTQYGWFFNRNMEYLKYDFCNFYYGGQQSSFGNRIYSAFQSSWLLQPVFKKNAFWVLLSKSCMKILFLLSKAIIHLVASHKSCLVNGNVKICRQHPPFLKSGMLRTTAAAFLAWGAGVWPPTSRMFSPCMKIMQVYSAMPKNQGNAVVQKLKCWQSSFCCITWSSAMEKYSELIKTDQKVLSLYVLLRLYEATFFCCCLFVRWHPRKVYMVNN